MVHACSWGMADFDEALIAAMTELSVGAPVRQALLVNDLTRVVDFVDVTEEDLIQGGLAKLAAKKLMGKVLPRAREIEAAAPTDRALNHPAARDTHTPPAPLRNREGASGSVSDSYTTLHRPVSNEEEQGETRGHAASADVGSAARVSNEPQYDLCTFNVKVSEKEEDVHASVATRPLPQVPPPRSPSAADVIYDDLLPAAFVVSGCEVFAWNGNYHHVPLAEVPNPQGLNICGEVYRHESAGVMCYPSDGHNMVAGSGETDGVLAWFLHIPDADDRLLRDGFVRGVTSCRGGNWITVNASRHWDLRPLPLTDEWYFTNSVMQGAKKSAMRIEISEAYLSETGLQRDVM